MKTWLIPLIGGGIFSVSVQAQESPPAAPTEASLQQACKADYKKLCADVQRGGGRIIACLNAHKDELTTACQEALLKAHPPRPRATAGRLRRRLSRNEPPAARCAGSRSWTARATAAPGVLSPHAVAGSYIWQPAALARIPGMPLEALRPAELFLLHQVGDDVRAALRIGEQEVHFRAGHQRLRVGQPTIQVRRIPGEA